MLVGCSGKAGVAYQIVSDGRTEVVLCIQSGPLKRQMRRQMWKKTDTQQGECRGGGEKRGYAGLHTTQCLNSTGSACPVALGHRGCIRAGDAQRTSLGSPGQVLPIYQRKEYFDSAIYRGQTIQFLYVLGFFQWRKHVNMYWKNLRFEDCLAKFGSINGRTKL